MNSVFTYYNREFQVDGCLARTRDAESAERKPVRIRKGEWRVVNFWGEFRGRDYPDRLAAIAGIIADGYIPVREFGVPLSARALGVDGRTYKTGKRYANEPR